MHRFSCAVAALILMAGCGYVGDPRPPLANVPEAIQGTVEVLLTATERGKGLVVYPPGR